MMKLSNCKKADFEAKKAGADAVKFQVFKPLALATENQKLNFKKTAGKEDSQVFLKRVCLNFSSLKT